MELARRARAQEPAEEWVEVALVGEEAVAADLPWGRVVIAFAQVVALPHRTSGACSVTSKSAPSVARQ